jgi:hypothetical protein
MSEYYRIPKRPGGGVSTEEIVAADTTAQPEARQYIYIYIYIYIYMGP